ncbi:hypothetical protein DMENIID0001_030740 [Sergentomyia squamirostris]
MEKILGSDSIRQCQLDKNAQVDKIYSVNEINCLLKGALSSNTGGGGCLFKPTNDSSFETSLEFKPLQKAAAKNCSRNLENYRVKVLKKQTKSGVGVRKCDKIAIGSVTLPIDLANNSVIKRNCGKFSPARENQENLSPEYTMKLHGKPLIRFPTIALTSTPIKSIRGGIIPESPDQCDSPISHEGGHDHENVATELKEEFTESEKDTMTIDCCEISTKKSKLSESEGHDGICVDANETCAPLTRENVEKHKDEEEEEVVEILLNDGGVEWGQNFDFSFICEPSTSDVEEDDDENSQLDISNNSPPKLMSAPLMTVSCAKIATIHRNDGDAVKPVVQQTPLTKYTSAIQSASIKSIKLFTVSYLNNSFLP